VEDGKESWKILSELLDCLKNTLNPSGFFTLLGSLHVKPVHKMLVKSTPGVDVTNVLRATFTCKDPTSEQRH